MLADFIAEFTLPDPDLEAEYLTICADDSPIVGLGGVGVIVTLPEKDILNMEFNSNF